MPSDIGQTVLFVAFVASPLVAVWLLYKLFYVIAYVVVTFFDRSPETPCDSVLTVKHHDEDSDWYRQHVIRSGGRDEFGRTESGALE